MKTEHLQQYNDLLPANADEATAHVVRDLHTLYASASAPEHVHAAIARAVQQRKMEQAQRPARQRGFFGGWQLRTVAVVAALLLAMVAGGTYALAPVLNRAFELDSEYDPGLQYVLDNHLYQEVNLSQTIDGYTVHVERVYADANRILIGYTLTGLEGQEFFNFFPGTATVITPDGQEVQGSYLEEPVIDGNSLGELRTFDMPEGYTKPDIALRFIIKDLEIYGKDDQATIDAGLRKPMGSVAGPFVFDLTVPVIAGRVAEINQTVTVNDVPVTLERVVVTPSETRMHLRFHDVPGKPVQEWEWSGHPRLTIDGWDTEQSYGEGGGYSDGPRSVYSRNFALFDKHGEWTLTVDKLLGHDPVKVAATKEVESAQYTMDVIEGPWEFKFIVP